MTFFLERLLINVVFNNVSINIIALKMPSLNLQMIFYLELKMMVIFGEDFNSSISAQSLTRLYHAYVIVYHWILLEKWVVVRDSALDCFLADLWCSPRLHPCPPVVLYTYSAYLSL